MTSGIAKSLCGRNRVNACAYYILRTDNFHLINRAAARQLISRTRPRRNRIYIDRQLQCNLLRSSAGQSNPIIKLLNLGRIARRVPRGRDCFSGIGYTDKKKPVRSISPRPPLYSTPPHPDGLLVHRASLMKIFSLSFIVVITSGNWISTREIRFDPIPNYRSLKSIAAR